MIFYICDREILKRKEGRPCRLLPISSAGHTDAIILAHLLSGDTYGYEINKSIQSITGNQYELKEATLYTAFRRLEAAGLIVSYWGDENTGARRRYYSITEPGRLRLSAIPAGLGQRQGAHRQPDPPAAEAGSPLNKPFYAEGLCQHERTHSGVCARAF